MKYDKYERDACSFGFPPAFFMSMIEHEQAHGCSRARSGTRSAGPTLPVIEGAMNIDHPGAKAASDVSVSDERLETTRRVFRSAKDITDALIKSRRLHTRSREKE